MHAARKDVADVALAGRLFAPHYARPLTLVCTAIALPVLDRPAGTQISELLEGELFAAVDIGGGWAWGYCRHDHYVGYVRADGLAALLDRAASAPVDPKAADPASIAEGLVGTPYHLGGRSTGGIDCSGLVQIALAPFGIAAPRDSDMQQEALGAELATDEKPARNDLVFFPGHVGMMVDGDRLIHASGSAGAVTIEPLADVVARFEGKPGMLVKRLPL